MSKKPYRTNCLEKVDSIITALSSKNGAQTCYRVVDNYKRSTEILRQLESIGTHDNTIGRTYLQEHLVNVYKTIKVIDHNGEILKMAFTLGFTSFLIKRTLGYVVNLNCYT